MDLHSADLIWSLFVSAINSYRKDLVARPFPPSFIDENGEKEFGRLTELLQNCPPLHEVNCKPDKCEQKLLSLLKWVLNPRLYTLKKTEFSKVTEVCSILPDGSMTPNFIFEIVHSKTQVQKFDSLKGSLKSIYAFHGSNLENFYSILNTGLKNNMNKTSLFGEGIYLSSDLSIVLHYSPMGKGWCKSIMGPSLSCVALCEMIDHPDVKCNIKYADEDTGSSTSKNGNSSCSKHSLSQRTPKTQKRSMIKGSEGGQIPDQYFVVRNDDLVRLRYLLVYSSSHCHLKRTGTRRFFARHQFLIVMILYVLILVFVSGLCDFSSVKSYL